MSEQSELQFRSRNLAERYIVDPHKPRRPVLGLTQPQDTNAPVEHITQTLQSIEATHTLEHKVAHWFDRSHHQHDSDPRQTNSLLDRVRMFRPHISFKVAGALGAAGVLFVGFVTLMTSLRASQLPVERTSTAQPSVKSSTLDPVNAVLGAKTDASNATNTTPERSITKENVILEEARPTVAQVERYAVSAGHIRYLSIPSVGVEQARVLRSSIASDGSIELPGNIWDGGWYESSALPSDRQGAVLIMGHIKGETSPGLFYNLYRIKTDDIISLTLGDGTVVRYKVVTKEDVLTDNIDTTSLMQSRDPLAASLTL